ncbi:hypothetical protein YPPY34_3976, partial [Yersinia pestis PY-34]
MASCCRGRTG